MVALDDVEYSQDKGARLRLRHCSGPQHEHGARHNLFLLASTGVGFICWFSIHCANVRLALISFPGRGHEPHVTSPVSKPETRTRSHLTTPASKPETREDVYMLSAECALALSTSISPGISFNRYVLAFQCLPVCQALKPS